MAEFLKQLASASGAVFAAACCAGAGWALAALSAVIAFAGLWTWLAAIWAGLAALVAASLWDFFAARIQYGRKTGNARTAAR